MVGSFVEAVQQIAQDAVRYYQLDGANAQALVLSQTLKSGINTLASVIEALKASGVELDPGDSSLKVFRQVVTGGLFDTLTRAALLPGAPIFELIANSSASLARKMQLAHFKSMTLKTGRLIDSGRK